MAWTTEQAALTAEGPKRLLWALVVLDVPVVLDTPVVLGTPVVLDALGALEAPVVLQAPAVLLRSAAVASRSMRGCCAASNPAALPSAALAWTTEQAALTA